MTTKVIRWRKIPSDPRYLVSDQGEVFGVSGKMLRPALAKRGGYRQVNIGGKTKQVSWLVAEAFLGPRPEGTQVAHLNGVNTDDRLTNLKYATKVENESHKIHHGTSNHGERNGSAKLTSYDILGVRLMLADGFTQQEVANQFGVCRQTVSDIKTGKLWSHV